MSEYAKLIARVKKVNRIAALRMSREIPLVAKRGAIDAENNTDPDVLIRDVDCLWVAFDFSSSPQGFDYWDDVCAAIGDW